ncbi:MAG TPA: hypothetical protein VLU99_08450 [Nitrososphaerales archaeon]|nr:hypothetical protein [Nitrososphaerales archaeon]HUK75809.1 hypothetical protein [Nitrososphaerales archaeon]
MKKSHVAFLVAQGVTVAAVLALVSLPLGTQVTNPPTSSPTTTSSTQVAETCTLAVVADPLPANATEGQFDAYANSSAMAHLVNFASRNITTLTNDFGPEAQVSWSGNTQGYGGSYNGTREINELYEGFLEPTKTLAITNESVTVVPIQSGSAVVVYTFDFSGNNRLWGNFAGAVVGQDYYNSANGWQISREDWNFVAFDIQYSLETMSGGSSSSTSCYP